MESYDYSPSQNKYFLLFNLHLQWVFISLIFTVNDDHVNEHDDHQEVAPFYGVKVLSHNLKSFRLFSVSLDFRCSFIREILMCNGKCWQIIIAGAPYLFFFNFYNEHTNSSFPCELLITVIFVIDVL